MLNIEEQSLIEDSINGNLDSFNQILIAYQTLAYNVAYRILNDSASAEDATQTAFISAFKSIKTFRGGSFKAWLMRIVTNACYDELRRQKRRPTTPVEPYDEHDEEVESPAWLSDDSPSPQDIAESAEFQKAVQKCLNQLPDEFRIVVVLVDIQGFDYQEVSTVIKKPLGTIKSRLARARIRLRDCLQGFRELLPLEFRLESKG